MSFMDWEVYKECTALCSMYKAKLENVINKRSATTVVYNEATASSFDKDKAIITLANENDRTKFHEFGHEIFHFCGKHNSIKMEELDNFIVENISCENMREDSLAVLDLVKEEYGVSMEGMIVLSDLLGMVIDDVIPHYYCHRKGYVQSCKEANIETNESFANVCGVIGSNCIDGVYMLQQLFPNFLASCLDLIDKAVREMPERR